MKDKIKFIKQHNISSKDGYEPVEPIALKYEGDEKIVVVPETVEGKTVTEISDFCFSKNSTVEEVILPKTIKKIGFKAFEQCKNLKKIHLNEGLYGLELGSFAGCTSLEEVVLPSTLEVVFYDVFINCTNLKKVVLQNKIKFNADRVFTGTTQLTDVNYNLLSNFSTKKQVGFIVEKLNECESYTPQEKKELLTFINRRINLKKAIFSGNYPKAISILIEHKSKLTLELLDEVLEISINNECSEVTAILLNYKNQNFSSKDIANYNEQNELVEIGLQSPTLKQLKAKWYATNTKDGIKITGYKGKNENETIPVATAEGIPIIQVSRTEKKMYEPIEVLTIEANIKTLGRNTFWDNITLKEIHLPPTITKLLDTCFSGCKNLEKFDIPESVTIEGNPFRGCNKFADKDGFIIIFDTLYSYIGTEDVVTVPNGVRVIEQSAFFNLKVKEIIFPEGLEEIKDYAINLCHSFKKITLPESTKFDKLNAFGFNTSVEEIIEF